MPSLTALDISSNPIRGAASVLAELRGLRSLQELRADMSPQDEDEVVVHLPQLRRLNGLSLVGEDEDEDEDGDEGDGLNAG